MTTHLLLALKISISEALMSLVSLFCKVDDFCLSFEPAWEAMLIKKEGHSRGYRRLSLGEVMTITIFFHQRHYRNFKHFYCDYLSRYHQFPLFSGKFSLGALT